MRQLLLVLVVAVAVSQARWLRRGRSEQPKETSFVGEATNELSTAIFQGYIDDNSNIAFSPLGYSAILAILAEGAEGETRKQLVSALHLPQDPNLTRKTYKFIMERLRNTHEYKYNVPELKNFFYIYKNYTINDKYKKILEDYYLTEVRSVERYNGETDFSDNSDSDDEDTETIIISDKKPIENIKDDVIDLVPPKPSEEKLISFAVEDKPEKPDISQLEYKPAKNIKEKIKWAKTNPKKHDGVGSDDEETMVAVEARNHEKSLKVLNEKTDISSSLSVNTVGHKANKPSASNSLMIIFNGMYFRGSWKKPFEKIEPGTFYLSNVEKKQVPMMKTTGVFKMGNLPELDSKAIMLPYDGNRYALLLVVPRTRDGLSRLTADLPVTLLSDVQESLQEQEACVCVPTFYVETTTKPVAALAKFGVSSIFSRDAELSGISSTEGLFVQELVQHVAVRVDNADASATELTASNPVTETSESLKNLPLSEKPKQKFSVEHPFLFYIVDRLDNLIVVAGKINDPVAAYTEL